MRMLFGLVLTLLFNTLGIAQEFDLGQHLANQYHHANKEFSLSAFLAERVELNAEAVAEPPRIVEVMPVAAIREGKVQEYSGTFQYLDEEILISLEDVQAGDTIYVYASGLGSVDTYVYVLDETTERVFAEDDDSGGGYNASLSYAVESTGTYYIGLITINNVGNYRLTIGVNAPQVLETGVLNAPSVNDFDCSQAERGDRPILSGLVQEHEGEAFIIHYTVTGRDATTQDYVETLALALNRSLDIQFNRLGWALPPSDCGEGGDSRLDVYVVDMSETSAIGYASPENVVGDNPSTPASELFAAYSFLAIENDMDGNPRRFALELLQTTAAHEVHHNIQFGYDVNDSYFGFYEAGASWIETLVYPTLTDAYTYVDDVFSKPDVCVGARNRGDLRIYGEWLMIDSLSRDLGQASYQRIWEHLSTGDGLDGFYAALDELGSSAQVVLQRMAIRNLLLDYTLAKRFESTVRLENRINGIGSVFPTRNGVQELGVDYLEITTQGAYQFELFAEGVPLEMLLIGVDTGSNTAYRHNLNQSGAVDTSVYDHAYLLIFNPLQHRSSEDCHFSAWSLEVSAADATNLIQAESEVWSAVQFIAPR